jgi:hypothetical protein
MFNNLKNRLIKGWSLMRVIRVALALIIIVQSLTTSEIIFAFLGGLLLFQAAFNYGCCGSGGCDVDYSTRKPKSLHSEKEITIFEEVK